ncbi:hypothetical protein BH23CHL5_BH23CHL5_18010 [soil metagenome]
MRLLPDLTHRADEQELLDAPIVNRQELIHNFRDIQRVNWLFGGTSAVLRYIEPMITDHPPSTTLRVIDLATGAADIPLAIAEWAEQKGRVLEITATDLTSDVLAIAEANTAHRNEIRCFRCDARAVPFSDGSFDIALCSLALHHFQPDDAVTVIKEMKRLANIGFLINDLRRSRLGYWATWTASRVSTRSHLTRNDAPLSIRRAYTVDELRALLSQAGIDKSEISLAPWFRMVAIHRTQI